MKFTKRFQNYILSVIIGFIIILTTSGMISATDDGDELLSTALNFVKQEQTEKAIPIFEKILESDPNNLFVLKNLAVAYTDRNMCNESIKIYDKILELQSNSPEILFGKSVCLNTLGLPESALLSLGQIDDRFSNDNSVLITKANSYFLLREFHTAEEYYLKVLEKKPDHKTANISMLKLSYHLKDHVLAEKFLVKILGDEPKRSSSCGASGCMGKIPFLFPVTDSDNFEIIAQVQVRNETDQLIAIIETEKITYPPHPIFDKILSKHSVLEIIQDDTTTYEVRKITQKSIPEINDYFMDRIDFYYNDYTILFGYNLAIPLETGDYIITEWTIKKKI